MTGSRWVGLPNTTIAIVKDVQILGTVFVDIDGREFVVPNSFLLANKIVNYTHAGIDNGHLEHSLCRSIMISICAEGDHG